MIPVHKADGSTVPTEVINNRIYAVVLEQWLSADDLERMAAGLRKLADLSRTVTA